MKTKEKTILLAEDDLDDQELLIEAMRNLSTSVQIKTVTNGNKAISFLKELAPEAFPQLIVLDYNLPEVNGAEILSFLQQNPRFNVIPKIVWSTSNSALYRTQCMELGANAYLVKPSDFSAIESMARQMLELCNND